MGCQLVWFKRDLRIDDHRPLVEAARRGKVLCLYAYEPIVYASEEFDPSHLVFINECLVELDRALKKRGGALIYRQGPILDILQKIHEQVRIDHLWSHEETGNDATYKRDLSVAQWAKSSSVAWTEIPQFGVFRPLKDRDGWARRWDERMEEPLVKAPEVLSAIEGVAPEGPRELAELGLGPSQKYEAQTGGFSKADEVLESFLAHRGVNYRVDMSSPVTAWEGCSRLSPYLAYGAVSMRRVFDETLKSKRMLREREKVAPIDRRWFASLSSFEGRLHWHCHFMQKLEDEPALEFENMSRAYDGIREGLVNTELLDGWKAGRTGYPMVDACMRALHRSGWINFRMRAMLVSFASYQLWLHWRVTGPYLASQFLDFEPGIHWTQMQMQSGTTGINSIRIYNPTKQVLDHDPTGAFIRRYVPELAGIPDEYIAEPSKTPPLLQLAAGCVIGKDYPLPIVDQKESYKLARERIWAVKKSARAKIEAKEILERHGSRRSG